MKRSLWEHRGLLLATGAVTLLPSLIGVLLWNRLPDTLATHFGVDSQANGWSSKPLAVFGLPLLMLGIQLLMAAVVCLDPKRRNISEKMFRVSLWIIPVTSLLCCTLTYAYALDAALQINRIVCAFLGVVFVVLGNYLPKCRQNYTVGIKLPWTLADEDNWYHTHRFGGVVWVLGGVAVLVLALLPGGVPVLPVAAVILVLTLLPIGYSLLYYLRRGRGDGSSGA